jgi:aspartyl-tRNA(Asn)/glutamyl-tRNA(Gln) amidotransferase subunit B
MKSYLPVVGLEVHVELKTNAKVFCGCGAGFSSDPNVHCCPRCTGMPGSLPSLSRTAVEYTVRAGLAFGCTINRFATFERKNYFYPDLPKAYQISQLEYPLCTGGGLDIAVPTGTKHIRLNRIHLEEDAGKLVHDPRGGTLVDYNRGGVPLIEIVTEPDLGSAEEALTFLETLKRVVRYTGISDCKMEQGSLRCDVNVSLHEPGTPLGTRTEMKNLASFKAAYRAIVYEVKRQTEILEAGGVIVQETRRWDDAKGKGFTMRTKEDAQDYRYFPDPDVPPIALSEAFIDNIRKSLPELAAAKAARYRAQYGLPAYDADVLCRDKAVADFFESAVAAYANPKIVGNWMMTEVLRKLKETGGAGDEEGEEASIPLDPAAFATLLQLLTEAKINQNAAKTVFEALWNGDTRAPAQIVDALGLAQVSDEGALKKVLEDIIAASPRAVADYQSGNPKAAAFFVGQAMKATKGAASPAVVNALIKQLLG